MDVIIQPCIYEEMEEGSKNANLCHTNSKVTESRAPQDQTALIPIHTFSANYIFIQIETQPCCKLSSYFQLHFDLRTNDFDLSF